MEGRVRELALFNLGIDSKLRGCDLVSLKVRDICHGDQVASRAVSCSTRPSDPDLSMHEESAGRPVVARAFQTRINRAISGHRGRRRLGDRRTDRDLSKARSGRPSIAKPRAKRMNGLLSPRGSFTDDVRPHARGQKRKCKHAAKIAPKRAFASGQRSRKHVDEVANRRLTSGDLRKQRVFSKWPHV